MYIEIHLNSDDLTEKDRAILTAIGNAGAPFEVVHETPAEEAKPETPKKRAPRKPKVVEPKETVADEPPTSDEVADEPALAPEPEEPKVDSKELINDAAERAVKLIRSGKRDEVKGILDMLGLEKVTALKDSPEKVQDFLDAISKLED